jgi:hypothetical protein
MFLDSSDSSPLTKADLDEISQFLRDKAAARRKVRVRHLSIFADGEELPVVFDVYSAKSITVEIEEGARKLELMVDQQDVNVPLAIHWFDWSDRPGTLEESMVTLEGGQQVGFRFTCDQDHGRVRGLVNITYRELSKIRAFQLALKRYSHRPRIRKRARSWASVPDLVQAFLLVVCVSLGVFLYRAGRRPPIMTTQSASQKLGIATGGVSGMEAPPDSTSQSDRRQNQAMIVRKKSDNRASTLSLQRREPQPLKGAIDNQKPEAQGEVAASAPNDFTYPNGATRTADPQPPNTPLMEVKTIYVDPSTFEGNAFAKTIYDVLAGDEGLSKISRFKVTKNIKESDTVLRGSVNKSDSGWDVSVRLVNRAGHVVWPGMVSVSGQDDQKVAEEAARKLVKKLEADVRSNQPTH